MNNFYFIVGRDDSPGAGFGGEGTDKGVKGGGVDSVLGNKDFVEGNEGSFPRNCFVAWRENYRGLILRNFWVFLSTDFG